MCRPPAHRWGLGQALDLAEASVPGGAAQILDLLRQVLEVERAVPALLGEGAQAFGLDLGPGLEVLLVELGCMLHGLELTAQRRWGHWSRLIP